MHSLGPARPLRATCSHRAIVRGPRSSACACAQIRRTRVIAAHASCARSERRRRIGGLPVLCEYVAGGSEDAEHVSVGAFSGTGIGVEALELAGRHEIASPAEVGERRRERPVVRVAAPDRIERGARSVASGERHAVVDVKSLDPNVRREIGSDIQLVQWRWPIGKPLVDGFGDGLFEVRTSLEGNIYRVIFCLEHHDDPLAWLPKETSQDTASRP